MAKKPRLTKTQIEMLDGVRRTGFAVCGKRAYWVGSKRYPLATGGKLFYERLIEPSPDRRDHRILSEAGYAYLRTCILSVHAA